MIDLNSTSALGDRINDPIDAVNMLILFKQARKLGQKPHRDNYRDAAGYESIAADKMLGD